LIVALASVSIGAYGTSHEVAPGPHIQRLQQQQVEAANAANPRPDALVPEVSGPVNSNLKHLPADKPCFAIDRLEVHDNAFDWLSRILQPIAGQCVGKGALKQIQETANNALIERGYVTSRVLVPPQSLESGVLTLRVVPGRLSEVRASQPAIGWLRSAVPTGPGEILSQRDIDQAIENVRRLQSQADATIDIAPGTQPGDSEIVLHSDLGKRWHALIGVDNAGLNGTGKYDLSGSFTFDSPLHLYDQLQIAGMANANFGSREKGNRSISINYSVPIGYTLLTVAASRSRYKQTVPGFEEPIRYSGAQSQSQLGVSRVVHRNAHARTEIRGSLFYKASRNYVDGVDVSSQSRDAVGYEVGVAHRRYVGNIVLDGALAWRASVPALSSNPGTVIDAPNFNGNTQIELASFGAQVPIHVGAHRFSYAFSWNTQNARTHVMPADFFTIGTRYSVRGFDQQLTLAAESGWAVSNEFDWYIPTPIGIQALYVGVDAGRVRGHAAQYLSGRTLVGSVMGARGSLATKRALGAVANYDLSVGWPLAKPDGFRTSSPTLLFQVSTLF